MRVRSGVRGVAALAAAIGVAAAPAPVSTSRFDTVFAVAGEPAYLHAVFTFAGGGRPHRLELWRDHEARILRVTDGRITTLATRTGRQAGGEGYDLVVLDHARRTSTRISRDNLYRLGAFTDWFDLSHGLRHPRGAYRLGPTIGAVPATLPATPAPCRWFDLTQASGVVHICWSGRDRLPLLITRADWVPVWRVTALDRATIAPARFVLDERGYIKNDASRDVEGD